MSEPTIREISVDERLDAARVAARALAEDPILLAAFASADGATRAIGMRAAFQSGLMRADPAPLGAFVDGGRLAGVWVSAPPGSKGASRIARLLEDLEEREPEIPRWRVGPVAVEPELQRQGIGEALMSAFSRRMDAIGAEAWLETGTEDGVRFYRRGGYEVVAETDEHGPHGWFLRRRPRT